MNYKICPDCGAYLDPDEICDCQAENSSPLSESIKLLNQLFEQKEN